MISYKPLLTNDVHRHIIVVDSTKRGGEKMADTKSNETVKNIQEMAPKLNEKQQHVVLGMLMGMMVGDQPGGQAEEREKKGA